MAHIACTDRACGFAWNKAKRSTCVKCGSSLPAHSGVPPGPPPWVSPLPFGVWGGAWGPKGGGRQQQQQQQQQQQLQQQQPPPNAAFGGKNKGGRKGAKKKKGGGGNSGASPLGKGKGANSRPQQQQQQRQQQPHQQSAPQQQQQQKGKGPLELVQELARVPGFLEPEEQQALEEKAAARGAAASATITEMEQSLAALRKHQAFQGLAGQTAMAAELETNLAAARQAAKDAKSPTQRLRELQQRITNKQRTAAAAAAQRKVDKAAVEAAVAQEERSAKAEAERFGELADLETELKEVQVKVDFDTAATAAAATAAAGGTSTPPAAAATAAPTTPGKMAVVERLLAEIKADNQAAAAAAAAAAAEAAAAAPPPASTTTQPAVATTNDAGGITGMDLWSDADIDGFFSKLAGNGTAGTEDDGGEDEDEPDAKKARLDAAHAERRVFFRQFAKDRSSPYG